MPWLHRGDFIRGRVKGRMVEHTLHSRMRSRDDLRVLGTKIEDDDLLGH